MIFEQLRLNIYDDVLVFTPLYEPATATMWRNRGSESLTIHRDSGLLALNAVLPSNPSLQELIVFGIIGFIQLQAGEYMIVITGREKIGSLQAKDIFRASTFQILPLAKRIAGLSEVEMQDEQTYIHLLEQHLKNNTFYYSYSYHLTLTLQQQCALDSSEAMWKQADTRFFWNRFLSEKLIAATEHDMDLSPYILPVMQGFVSITHTALHKHPTVFALISRRSHERAGTRYFSRGLDKQGHASNFVETEQIIASDATQNLTDSADRYMSFIQTRGSVPSRWGQFPNTRYMPELWIDNIADRSVLSTSRAHFNDQVERYGPQVLVNLVNKKGYEFPVGNLYAETVGMLDDPRLTYIHFDFHQECQRMNWNRVQVLVDQLEPMLLRHSYCDVVYRTTAPGIEHIRRQTAVIRTSCMDCLDRTNVVQSAFARRLLTEQLREMGVLRPTEFVDQQDRFMTLFRQVWSDNADALSVAYSGTGALKTDYTRTGKRTYMGALNDLHNSLERYIKNNYLDGARQDGIDLFLGNYIVRSAAYSSRRGRSTSVFERNKPWQTQMVPIAFVMSIFTFLSCLFWPELVGPVSSTAYLLILSICFATTIWSWRFIQLYGSLYVDWPVLVPIDPPPIMDETNIARDTYSRHGQISSWRTPPQRSNTAMLDTAEQGYELPTLKKTT